MGPQAQSQFDGWDGEQGEPARDRELLWSSGDHLYRRMSSAAADGERCDRIAVVPSAEHPTPSSVSRLVHEFTLKDHLDSAWAVRPLELVRERGRTMLLLEHVEAKPLDRIVAGPWDLDWFLRLAIAASNAVTRLQASGLVHKDLKGRNLLVDSVTGLVRLTGFGIASRLPRERQAPQPPELLAGTLSHMAPEQTGRMNRSIDSR